MRPDEHISKAIDELELAREVLVSSTSSTAFPAECFNPSRSKPDSAIKDACQVVAGEYVTSAPHRLGAPIQVKCARAFSGAPGAHPAMVKRKFVELTLADGYVWVVGPRALVIVRKCVEVDPERATQELGLPLPELNKRTRQRMKQLCVDFLMERSQEREDEAAKARKSKKGHTRPKICAEECRAAAIDFVEWIDKKVKA